MEITRRQSQLATLQQQVGEAAKVLGQARSQLDIVRELQAESAGGRSTPEQAQAHATQLQQAALAVTMKEQELARLRAHAEQVCAEVLQRQAAINALQGTTSFTQAPKPTKQAKKQAAGGKKGKSTASAASGTSDSDATTEGASTDGGSSSDSGADGGNFMSPGLLDTNRTIHVSVVPERLRPKRLHRFGEWAVLNGVPADVCA